MSKKTGITVAVLTFVCTLLGFGQSEVTSLKESAIKKKEKVIEIRGVLEALTPEELPAQLPLINRRLDEEV